MRRGRSTGKPTGPQQARFAAIQEIGCICCRLMNRCGPAEIHHLTVGGKHGQKRRGHDFTIGLCCYHHRGVAAGGFTPVRGLSQQMGPSYALEPRNFRITFGDDDTLLKYQNELIDQNTQRAA